VPLEADLYDRYQLERFTDWVSRTDTINYRLSKESIWRALENGIEIQRILAFLRRVTGGTLSAAQARAIQDWAAGYGRVALRHTVLLQTTDAETMRSLRKSAELNGPLLNPRTALIEEESWEKVVAILKRLGYWPKIEGKAPNRHETDR